MRAITTTIRTWGNSQGIRIPREILEMLDFHINEELRLEVSGNELRMKKETTRKTLEEYAAPYGGLGPYKEFDWGEGIGFDRWIDEKD